MTRNVTVGWIKTTSSASEKKIPTEWIGKRNLKLDSKNDIDIIVLEGYNRYDEHYRDELECIGYTLIDATDRYLSLSKKYSALNRFGDYEKKCFLRWLVLEEIYGDEPVIHYDGDIIFNETPENLQKRFNHKTFVLQGCPAVVSLHSHEWYDEYCRNMDLFIDNIERYSGDAWKRRTGWEESVMLNWAGARYRKIISSDQDLIRHLIHVRDLPQDSPESILRNNRDVIFFENPLYFFFYETENTPFVYKRAGNIDYFNDRKVAFWHLQGYFKEYLQRAYFWNYILKLKTRIPNIVTQSDRSRVWKIQFFFQKIMKLPITSRYSRLRICQAFFDQHDFSKVFDPDCFWINPMDPEELKKNSGITSTLKNSDTELERNR